jgi:hypothetical protein
MLHESPLAFERGAQLILKTLYDTTPSDTIILDSGMYSTKTTFSTIELDLSFISLSELATKLPKNLDEQPLRQAIMDAMATLPQNMQNYALL